MKTRLFAYRGFLGILSIFKSEGLENDPAKGGRFGFVVDASKVECSKEALDELDKIKRSGDDIGDVDSFMAGDKTIFAWLGGPMKLINPKKSDGSRTYDVSILRKAFIIVPNDVPKDFSKAVDSGFSKK